MSKEISKYFNRQGPKDFAVPSFRIDEQHNTKLEKLLTHFNTNNTDFFTGMIDFAYDLEIIGIVDTDQTKNAGAQTPASTKTKSKPQQK